jgi:ATP-binding cassette subfamily B protein
MNNLMTAGQFVLLVALAMQVLLPVSFLGSIWKEAMRLLADVSKLSELLEAPSVQYNAPTTSKEIAEVPPSISFNNVVFAYVNDDNFLSDVSFSVPSGGVAALVGESGSGKTTITKLLLGFIEQKSGEIQINGNTTTQQERRLYRGHVGVVPQNVTLFHGTIASNIAYGKRLASMAEIEAAAKLAQIDGFIKTLPEGYSTQVGERGLKLSGGQRQMLGIARALINNPKLLILDEASSALDSLSESRFIESALTARQGRTCIVIAHRLSMVTQADLILVLDKGAIIESGTHATLLDKKGKYAALWAAQK